MAKTHLDPMPVSGRPSDHRDGGGRVWRWVFFSGAAHAVLIAVLLIVPFLPNKTPSYPVYTVDLVGGEKLGAGAGTSVAPVPKAKPVPEVKASPEIREAKQETKKEAKKAKGKEEGRPNAAELKEANKKAPDKRAEMAEKLALAKAKKEQEEAEAEKTREKLKELRERRIADALAAIRSRAESQEQKEQQQQKAAATSTVSGDKPGAAAPGIGGTGGGIVEDVEFIAYRNEISERIKASWTWAGRKADLRVLVHMSIQENGEISGLKITRSSGDSSFDDSVIRALKKANPLPPPPEKFRQKFSDVNVPFSLKELGS
ncbi:MAG: cell envelope integrity protein TolA [Candidatus Binatia bacterium]